MTDTVIRVENLSKRYQLGVARHDTLRDRLAHAIHAPFNRLKGVTAPDPTEFWALRDVNFEVKRGEVLGVIGHNGAGKSTLLKILSRITEPTKGRITIHGRVASLLEVGTGFHPELTGRENVFLNGAILGMARAEIRRKFDEIVAFAEVERFLDTPVKHYSSGMYVRLAFAVAAHLEPEILIVDEVLAVGDAQFQKKCLGKMSEVARAHERTVLFVSHNMTALKSLCPRGILLERGRLRSAAAIGPVIDQYLQAYAQQVTHRQWPPGQQPGTERFRFRSIELQTGQTGESAHLTTASGFSLALEVEASFTSTINLSLEFRLSSGEVVFATASPTCAVRPGAIATFSCAVPGGLLNDESYIVNAMIVENGQPRFVLQDAVVFQVHDVRSPGSWLGKWPGTVRPELHWQSHSDLPS